MTTEHTYLQKLTEKLKELNPHMVLLFGSQAYGTLHRDSDIDLLVVTNEDYFPQTYDERVEIQLSVSKHIFEIAKQVPVDLIVYTLPMYKRFIEQNSSFAQEILSRGKVLYEGYNPKVA